MGTRLVVEDYEKAMRAARRWSTWYLGSASWAERFLGVLMNPAAAVEELEEEERQYNQDPV